MTARAWAARCRAGRSPAPRAPAARLGWLAALTLGLLPAATQAQVVLRTDHPDLSRTAARGMTPAALADALLAPGHPSIVGMTFLPEGLAPPPPPGSPVMFQVRLEGAGALDAPSGFCVKRTYAVTIVRRGAVDAADALTPTTYYRLPTPGSRSCDGNVHAFFVAPSPSDRTRAFQVVRLLAAATHAARHARPAFPVTVDDQLDRDMQQFAAEHPSPRAPGDPTYPVITDGAVAMAALHPDTISYVGHDRADSDLLAPALLVDGDGRPRERWQLFIRGSWTVDLVLDGDRIAAVALRNAMPPPF